MRCSLALSRSTLCFCPWMSDSNILSLLKKLSRKPGWPPTRLLFWGFISKQSVLSVFPKRLSSADSCELGFKHRETVWRQLLLQYLTWSHISFNTFTPLRRALLFHRAHYPSGFCFHYASAPLFCSGIIQLCPDMRPCSCPHDPLETPRRNLFKLATNMN